mmetsp:Transcript_41907/g.97601  ORF Transcript_41907/g.97601 Transcript_41907/m.97601 type:complete len:208 (-) Transcript_41907:1165-1788(-)
MEAFYSQARARGPQVPRHIRHRRFVSDRPTGHAGGDGFGSSTVPLDPRARRRCRCDRDFGHEASSFGCWWAWRAWCWCWNVGEGGGWQGEVRNKSDPLDNKPEEVGERRRRSPRLLGSGGNAAAHRRGQDYGPIRHPHRGYGSDECLCHGREFRMCRRTVCRHAGQDGWPGSVRSDTLSRVFGAFLCRRVWPGTCLPPVQNPLRLLP